MIFNYKSVFLVISSYLTALPRIRERSKMRKMLRGYRYLKSTNRLHIIEDAVQHLREYELDIPTSKFSKLLWGAGLCSAELITRQRLSSRYIGLNRALLIAVSSPSGFVSIAIPRIWRVQLEHIGFSIDHTKCSIYWALALAKKFMFGLAKALLLLGEAICNWSPTHDFGNQYIYFCDLVRNNLPADDQDFQSYCLINWYSQWNGRDHLISHLRHGVTMANLNYKGIYNITFQKNPVPPLFDIRQKLAYVSWLVKAFYSCVVSLFSGAWWNLLILPEAVTAISVRLQSPSLFAKEYWFHNSLCYPPLWTYELPAKHSKAIYYFYSINCEPLSRSDGSKPFVTPYSLMNWPHYLIWDKPLSAFIRNTQSINASMLVSGPVWFSDCTNNHKALKPLSIALFNVTPHRSLAYSRLGIATEYYVPEITNAFLDQVIQCAVELGIIIAFKEKRVIKRTAHPLHRAYMNSIKCNPNVDILNPSVSAIQIIKQSIGCISFPFTSTAFIARSEGISSVYFDPTASLCVDDTDTRGIAILKNKRSLNEWMKALLVSRT